jgi:hypothetical protein
VSERFQDPTSWHRFFGLPSFQECPEIVSNFQIATACFLCNPWLAVKYINSNPLLRIPVNQISKLGISQLTTKSKFCCPRLQSPTTTFHHSNCSSFILSLWKWKRSKTWGPSKKKWCFCSFSHHKLRVSYFSQDFPSSPTLLNIFLTIL